MIIGLLLIWFALSIPFAIVLGIAMRGRECPQPGSSQVFIGGSVITTDRPLSAEQAHHLQDQFRKAQQGEGIVVLPHYMHVRQVLPSERLAQRASVQDAAYRMTPLDPNFPHPAPKGKTCTRTDPGHDPLLCWLCIADRLDRLAAEDAVYHERWGERTMGGKPALPDRRSGPDNRRSSEDRRGHGPAEYDEGARATGNFRRLSYFDRRKDTYASGDRRRVYQGDDCRECERYPACEGNCQ